MRDVFERAIIENPDDVASYSAYADWLQEHDDPRGEFIAVQLAFEDEIASSKEARDATSRNVRRSYSLRHEGEWLGELAAVSARPSGKIPSGIPIVSVSLEPWLSRRTWTSSDM